MADDVAAAPDEEHDYVVEQFIVREGISSLSAKIKVGKTTLVGYWLHGIFFGHSVAGFDTRPAKVLYCTEEGRKSWKAFLRRTGLENTQGQLEVLFLNKVPKVYDWPNIVNAVLAHALRVNADVVIFDTLSRWAKIKPDQENDAGVAAAVMEPLENLRAARLAVLGIFHERKSGGDISDAARGSSAFGGAADILISLTNPNTNGHPNRRVLQSIGRFDDPGEWVIDLVDGEYVRQNEDGSLDIERNNLKILIDLYLNQGPLTGPALAEAIGVRATSGTFRRALDDMVKDRQVAREGSGKRGNPWIYSLAPISVPK